MKEKIFYFFLFSSFWGLIFFYVLFSIIPESPLKPINNINLQYYLPEGWGFFTRTPREDNIYVYKYHKNGLSLFQHPNASPKYFFGLKKTSRSIGAEYGRILNNLNPKWTTFSGEKNIKKISDTIKIHYFTNNEKNPMLEGDFILVAFKPIPWAWAKDFNHEFREGKMVKINISCSK